MTTPTLASRPRLLLDADTLARAKASPHLPSLTAWCDARMTGTIYPPTMTSDSNNPPAVYPGYESEEYSPTVVSMALAYRLTGNTAYADRCIAILLVMADGKAVPSTDDGYIVRNYVRALAIGADFCHDRMTAAQLTTVSNCINAFLAYWKQGHAFEDTPVAGNYWAGYFGVDALASLGLYEDNPNAPADWDTWRGTHYPKTAADFLKYLDGGGWPEGFEYAPLALENIALAVRAVMTATGEDLADLRSYILACARFVRHGTWPDGSRPDDRDMIHSGPGQGATDPDLLWLLQYMLNAYSDPFAAAFRKLRNAHGVPSQAWRAVLYDEPAGAPESDPAELSYLGGMGTALMRSDWSPNAVWASIRNAPYAGYPDAAEQFCDQGSLSIVSGAGVVLANPWGAWMRDAQADAIESKYGYDVQTGKPIFAVFMTDKGGQNQNASGTNATTMVDAGDHVYTRCSGIEQMYDAGVTKWTREVVFLREERAFIIRDTTADDASDRWLQFHAMKASISGSRVDLGTGTMDVPYPADAAITAQGAPAGFKAVTQQIEVRSASNPGTWVTIVQVGAPEAVTCADGQTVAIGSTTVQFTAAGVSVNGQAPTPAPAPPPPAPSPAPVPPAPPAPPPPPPAPVPAPPAPKPHMHITRVGDYQVVGGSEHAALKDAKTEARNLAKASPGETITITSPTYTVTYD